MMITRTTENFDLIGVLTERGAIGVDVLVSGEWKPSSNLAMQYEAAINALIRQARRDGFRVWSGDSCIELLETTVCEEAGYEEIFGEECDQLGEGCTCESCTRQIKNALGM